MSLYLFWIPYSVGDSYVFYNYNIHFIMIERIISFSLRNKFIVGLFVFVLIVAGVFSLFRLPMDVTPDITNNQVQIIAIAPSLAAQEIESSITSPLEVAVANIPGIIEHRSISRLGLSVITIVFNEDVDIYWARQQVGERLQEAEENIPKGIADISLAPISTGLGEIYQYNLVVDTIHKKDFSPMDLRTLQDWTIRRGLLGTEGVADVNSYGGFVKQYEVTVDPNLMKSMGVSLSDVFLALQKNNENTGSAYIEKGATSMFIRGIGLVNSFDDIAKIVVKSNGRTVVWMRDVATVQLGSATRYGAYIVDGKESVGGVVMMLKNANSKDVVKNVETKMNDIQKTLPAGVSIEPYLNRADLIGRTIHTIAGNLIEGALIVIFVLILFIGNIRGGFIVASVIPLSMMFAFVLMNLFGVSGNLMSLGAIDFGMIVDGAVIIVDCVVEKLTIQQNNLKISFSQKSIDDTVRESTKRMMSSAIFGQIIIFIVYLPIISLVGIEGKMFRPMAEVVSFALIGAAILSLTYVPVASSLLLRRKKAFSFSEKLMSAIRHLFVPIINFSLRHKVSVFSLSLALFVSSLVAFSFLGGEFIPQLEEGDLAASVVTLQGGSLSNTITQAKKADSLLRARFPEIKHIVCKIGTGEIPNDPMPFETGDLVITLTPKKQWTSAKTTAHMEELMQQTLAPLAGVQFEFQQPIQIRQNELLSGSKQDVSIKIFGDDMDILSTESKKVKRLIHDIPGVTEVVVEQVTGLAQVHIVYNRDLLAEYGVSIADVNDVLRAAFAGSKAGTVYEGEKRFDLVVRFNPASRTSIEDVCNIPILLPNGMQMPLNQLADVYVSDGPSQVSRENTHRRIVVGFNVRGADVETVVNNVQSRLSRDLQLPSGYYITLGGEFKNLQDAKARLVIAVPIALISIFILLYFAFHSVREALLIYSAVPMSIIGGIWALWFRNMNFSISAGVGFIALFGIAVLNGIVLVSDFNKRERNGERNVVRRVVEGVNARLRPVFITAVSACLGFLPMAVSSSAGAEVQKPLATVVIGGLITSTLLTLVLLPVLYIFFNSLKNKRQ